MILWVSDDEAVAVILDWISSGNFAIYYTAYIQFESIRSDDFLFYFLWFMGLFWIPFPWFSVLTAIKNNLEMKARAYEEPTIAAIFLMNNFSYIDR